MTLSHDSSASPEAITYDHHDVNTNGIRLHVVQAGPQNGPLVILLRQREKVAHRGLPPPPAPPPILREGSPLQRVLRSPPLVLGEGLGVGAVFEVCDPSASLRACFFRVALLHGFPEFWYAWRHQISYLANAGYRVWVPDQRGYNLSDKPKGIAAYNLDHLANDIIGLIDAAGQQKVFLVGHDWGAAVTWWVANKYPERLERS